jgi:ABC-type polysaccharide/polyol phosphate transport system ATPase subunit
MDDPVIKIEHLYKRFRRNMTSFQSIIGYTLGFSSPHDFWALDDISLEIHRGESIGIIGPNGAGKSTLLKVLVGIIRPTKGTVSVKGRTGALIEVGAGFNPELTGRENIFLYGAILGMTKKEIRKKFDEIVEFSGLRHMLDTPVKFYSSGMYLRLGFAVTVHTDPDILIIDEAMAVGDSEV